MDWSGARERLGAELIGARGTIAHRWRLLLAEAGQAATSLESLVQELVLQAGAALADGQSPDAPWTRCGGILRIDAHSGETVLTTELTTLWKAMSQELQRLCLTIEEERAAAEVLARQLDAALRGAAAEVANLVYGTEPKEPSLRFGGVKVLVWPSAVESATTQAA
ncbi:MAG: hypothetical protein JST92_24690 [Deltaproteobacteria bacterium]|nr:hypothetical protein [Deltaproteobacteria bacterium]